MKQYKVFISYAWTDQDYESWVISLAERLMDNGVEVIFDKWNLEIGQDKYVFMEKMVQDNSIDHVLLMLNENYKERADKRSGGVGTESQIISSELYNKTDQTKFIPIITERNDEGKEFTPTFLKNRIYVDLSDEGNFESEYEKLLRFIYKRPQYKKPKIGTPPTFLFDEKDNNSRLIILEKVLESSISKNDKAIIPKIMDYTEQLKDDLSVFRIQFNNEDTLTLGKMLYEKFIEMTFLRDSFLRIVKHLAIYGEKNHYEKLYDFFKDIDQFYQPEKQKRSSWTEGEFDQYALYFYELIISTFAILIKYERMDLIKYSLKCIFIDEPVDNIFFEPIEKRMKTIFNKIKACKYIPVYYKSISGKNYYQPIVEALKIRIFEQISLSDMIQADLLLHYYRINEERYNQYFPRFSLYIGKSNMSLFNNLIFSEKIKNILDIFGVENEKELEDYLNNGNFPYDEITIGDFDKIPRLTNIIKPELWGKK